MMARTLSLPARFFRNYSSGEISERLGAASGICTKLVNAVMTTALTAAFSLIYIGQIFVYAPGLILPALAVILTCLILSTLASFAQLKHSGMIM
jgi:ABC-type bacteriocin/lantibiotic exporter with double-glycine peptidase domain